MSEARNIPCIIAHENRPRRKGHDLSFGRMPEPTPPLAGAQVCFIAVLKS
jgi:hypothetical protein